MRLLIIGNLDGQLVAASKIATQNGAKVLHVSDIKSALMAFRTGKPIDMIFIDFNEDIKNLKTKMELERFSSPIIACGIVNDKEKAIKAIKNGAQEFLPLPPEEKLIAAIFEAISKSDEQDFIIAHSPKFKDAITIAKQVANSEASVLITGESGTGKEVIAKFIHSTSKRHNHELISLNCAAIPDNLLESELFGHEKGSFTGALERRIGKFETANNSTILLDEISEMDLRLQAKLLRVIQEKELSRLGGNNTIKINVRILATSNRNLMNYVKEGKFREDLYYRLNVINIDLAPLRQRALDIMPLAKFFIEKYSKLNDIPQKNFSELAECKMLSYPWYGNVRELENTVHRALLLSQENLIQEHDLLLSDPLVITNQSGVERTLEEIEHDAIENAMKANKGDETKAAMILGISLKTLRSKLQSIKKAA